VLVGLKIITTTINVFVYRNKVESSEALWPGSVLLRKGKQRKPGRRGMYLVDNGYAARFHIAIAILSKSLFHQNEYIR